MLTFSLPPPSLIPRILGRKVLRREKVKSKARTALKGGVRGVRAVCVCVCGGGGMGPATYHTTQTLDMAIAKLAAHGGSWGEKHVV